MDLYILAEVHVTCIQILFTEQELDGVGVYGLYTFMYIYVNQSFLYIMMYLSTLCIHITKDYLLVL